ncbi:hypothetical protein [Paludisphaera sp.]|uniref:hypothetical protein n=1 Tax=Paludisphaera sp. TaxID=2017432 RepID=UPI00301C9120
MTAPRPKPKFEHERLDYPSDRVTIKMIRASKPSAFEKIDSDFFFAEGLYNPRIGIGCMLEQERQIAHRAFAAAVGEPDPYADEDLSRKDLIRMLTDEYKPLGLSSGIKHTEQLVRDIERQAVAQAHKQLGQSR